MGGLEQALDSRVEALRGGELLQIEVHPVAPIVGHDGRHVDALGLRIGVAEFFIHRQQILKREINAAAHADLLNQLKAEL